jgi:OOP family OmpA-OmpF porin
MRPAPSLRLTPALFSPRRLLPCLLLALLAAPASAQTAPAAASATAADKPVIAAGTVPDEATRAAVLARLHELYGAQRVVDRIEVDAVMAPPNWRERVVAMLGPDLQQVRGGELAVNGNSVRISGQVGNEAERQQVASALATAAGPNFLVKNALRGGGNRQQELLDQALADRIIEFESGSATLTAAGRAILDEMVVAMKQVGDQQVQVIGHTDDVGRREANVALSLQRAIAVKAYLEAAGVAADNLSVQGFGPDRPVADNSSPEGRARNRRIEFRVL